MLRNIKTYIRQHQLVSAQQLADHFDVELDTVFFWMDFLIDNGHVQQLDAPACSVGNCGGCTARAEGSVLYRWLPRPYRPLAIPLVQLNSEPK